ncbi:2-hydroxy-3-oxopropionate reductase [Acrodontium crateriforme]|uniref:3-hydroxyisobutyrate dehydrogenase n=1 Tax=Acrodontium crateriforme TaxID=150365 RepID=A0AAQ3M756_9PEZI|nr:2-hydroxy-3-oxopropionate reductase [Acrodontium crateriforme]
MDSNILKSGYDLVVYDLGASKVQKAVEQWPNTTDFRANTSAFKDCEVVITMLPQGKIVREVLLGKDNIASGLQPGAIIVDTSSSSPFDTQELGKELAKRQLRLVDAPIEQTYMHAADAGENTLMVGSDCKEVFEKVEPILRCMAGYIFYMGRLGNGHAMKTLNNYIMASSICALSDSLFKGQKYGLDPQQMIDELNVDTGVCFPSLDTFRSNGVTGRCNSGFDMA